MLNRLSSPKTGLIHSNHKSTIRKCDDSDEHKILQKIHVSQRLLMQSRITSHNQHYKAFTVSVFHTIVTDKTDSDQQYHISTFAVRSFIAHIHITKSWQDKESHNVSSKLAISIKSHIMYIVSLCLKILHCTKHVYTTSLKMRLDLHVINYKIIKTYQARYYNMTVITSWVLSFFVTHNACNL